VALGRAVVEPALPVLERAAANPALVLPLLHAARALLLVRRRGFVTHSSPFAQARLAQ